MAKPVVWLFTRDDCRLCRCGLARNLLKELKDSNRCDGGEFNINRLTSDHFMVKYARSRGFRHFPTFLFFHPQKKEPEEKIWADDKDRWENGSIRKEINAILDRIWRMR